MKLANLHYRLVSENKLERMFNSVAERMHTEFQLSGGFTHRAEKGSAREKESPQSPLRLRRLTEVTRKPPANTTRGR